eukprot:6172156-Lingulodinium_polyedra.AAC.1
MPRGDPQAQVLGVPRQQRHRAPGGPGDAPAGGQGGPGWSRPAAPVASRPLAPGNAPAQEAPLGRGERVELGPVRGPK